jgi:uncharacterized membrane protein
VHGTWKTADGGVPVAAIVGAVAVLAVLAWLATVLWVLAAIGFVILVLAVAAVILLRRGNPADAAAIAAQAAALRESQRRTLDGPWHLHIHIHGAADEDSAARIIRQALPERRD